MRRAHITLAAAIWCIAFRVLVTGQTTSPVTVWNGVYSEAQAGRGETAYGSHCARCHAEDLSGYQNLLKGNRFMNEYREAPLYRLFDKMKTTMPRDAAGTLSDQTYLDILTYILKANDFPAGHDDLAAENLSRVLVVGKAGPEPVPNFSLVQVFGCLTRDGSGDGWVLTGATEFVRATRPQASRDEITSGASAPLGAGTVELLLSPAYAPESHSGHKVDARGFLIRRPEGNRINVTGLETVAPDCH